MSDEAKLARRIRAIELRAELCRRQEGRRGMPKAKAMMEKPNVKRESSDGDLDGPELGRETQHLPLKCKPTQCIFCMGNDCLLYPARIFAYKRLNKLRDHVENRHLSKITPDSPVRCNHPVCIASDIVLPGVKGFKNHTETVHKIKLRA